MRFDFGLQAVAGGKAQEMRRELPDDDGGGQREQRGCCFEHALQAGKRSP